MTWDGDERRNSSRDHDLLTKIDANLSNFMSRFDEHAKEDSGQFQKIDERIGKSEKFIYMAMGALVVLEIILKVYQK